MAVKVIQENSFIKRNEGNYIQFKNKENNLKIRIKVSGKTIKIRRTSKIKHLINFKKTSLRKIKNAMWCPGTLSVGMSIYVLKRKQGLVELFGVSSTGKDNAPKVVNNCLINKNVLRINRINRIWCKNFFTF